jgi:membrane protein YqaA with SNARE-associated domain
MTRKMIVKFIFGLLLLIASAAFCAWAFHEEVEHYGQLFIDKYGLLGIAIGTLICDTSPIPLTNEPLALIALGANIPFWHIVVTMSIASHCGAPLGYLCGYFLGKQNWFQKLVQNKHPDLMDKGKEYAVRAVALGALLPIPYAITTWVAGAVQADFKMVVLAGSLRWIKNTISVSLVIGGWALGQS